MPAPPLVIGRTAICQKRTDGGRLGAALGGTFARAAGAMAERGIFAAAAANGRPYRRSMGPSAGTVGPAIVAAGGAGPAEIADRARRAAGAARDRCASGAAAGTRPAADRSAGARRPHPDRGCYRIRRREPRRAFGGGYRR